MTAAGDALLTIAPAIAFLLAAVPFARMLGDLGFFDAVVTWLARDGRSVSVAALWALSAVTTAILNLDTTVVLLTPLAIRLARRSGVDPLPLAVVPLLLAGLASSFLPVSNLTTLIVVERFDVGALDVLAGLGPPSLAAVLVGWGVHRRRVPARLVVGDVERADPAGDRRALRLGGAVIAGLLAWFTVGEAVGLPPWLGLVVAVAVLSVVTRTVPWTGLPFATAAGVTAVAALLGAAAPDGLGSERFWAPETTAGRLGVLGASVVAANLVNNVPATLLMTAPDALMTDGRWLWLFGVNAGSLVLPSGTLAALLWWRLVAAEGVPLDLRRYLRLVVPVVAVAFAVASAVALLTVPSA